MILLYFIVIYVTLNFDSINYIINKSQYFGCYEFHIALAVVGIGKLIEDTHLLLFSTRLGTGHIHFMGQFIF